MGVEMVKIETTEEQRENMKSAVLNKITYPKIILEMFLAGEKVSDDKKEQAVQVIDEIAEIVRGL